MAEYIDKDYTINKIKSLDVAAGNTMYTDAFTILKKAVIEFVKNIATRDVVEVVRCRDCVHRPFRISGASEDRDGLNLKFPDDWCPLQCADGWYNIMPRYDFFCGYGERKEKSNG